MDQDTQNDKEETIPEMYISSSETVKENIVSYTYYTISGTAFQDPLIRKHRDFDSLRTKLVERWPGVFIPGLPLKKQSADINYEDLRKEMLNRFCLRISKYPFLFKSDEMICFMENVRDVSKALASFEPLSYEALLKRYSITFTNYDDNFDVLQGKANQTSFLQKLKETVPKLKSFKELVKYSRDKFQNELSDESDIIDMFSLYEKDCLESICDSDKLLFYNMKNNVLSDNIADFKTNSMNPYDTLYIDLSEEIQDSEAMIEALNGLVNLQDTYDKLTKQYGNLCSQISGMEAGKTNFMSMFKMFKGREQSLQSLTDEKDKLEKDRHDLEQVIKIATFNLENEIINFKSRSLDSYYKELSDLQERFEKNNKLANAVWENVLSHEAVQNCE
jgi:hypothetical protein